MDLPRDLGHDEASRPSGGEDRERAPAEGAGRVRRVLLVCTANHCRSPLAAAMLRSRLDELGIEIEVESAALRNVMVGMPPSPTMVEVARRRGIEVTGRATWASPERLAAADLVVCMDHAHAEMLREDLRLSRGGPPVRLLLEFAPECGREEVPDPHGLDEAAHEAVAAIVDRGVRGLARSIAGDR